MKWGQLACSFNRMADTVQESFQRSEEARSKAEDAYRLKSEFLASMSHELRTPLNGILGYSELLRMELTEPDQQEFAATIHSSGEHLLNIVNDILDLAKIEAGGIELKPSDVEVARLANELVATHRATCAGQGAGGGAGVWHPACRRRVHTDALRVRQILNNLLNNAVKFTENGKGWACASAGMVPSWPLRSSIPVAAFRPEALELVFEKFRQTGPFRDPRSWRIGPWPGART